jgi:hypothetical protein
MMPDDKDDDRIDELVCAASARPFNEARLTANVLTRIRQDARRETSAWGRLFAFPDFAGAGRLAPVGFALTLIATPFAVAHYPDDPTARAIYAVALGDPALIASTERTLWSVGFLE